MKHLIFIGLLALALQSCKTSFVSGSSAEPNISINYNVEAELEIDKSKTLQASSTTKTNLGFIKIQDKNFSDAYPKNGFVGIKEKMAATYKALEGTGYDVLVNPKYVIQTKKGLFIKSITATVAGYGAKVKL